MSASTSTRALADVDRPIDGEVDDIAWLDEGRPPGRPDPSVRPTVLAVDIGGTKLAAALVDAAGGVRARTSTPTDRSARVAAGGPADILDAIVVLARTTAARAEEPLAGVGVASAGPVDLPAGSVAPVNIPDLHGRPVLDALADLAPAGPARLVGDGLAAAAGEHWTGAGRGHDDMAAIVVSTGVGGGLVLGGRLHYGASGNAGHLGHAPVVVDGEACACGAAGCPEVYASGPNLVAWARDNGWDPPSNRFDAADLAAAAKAGDRVAVAAFERGGRALGAMLAAAVASCDVTAIVVGGGVARAGDILLDAVRGSFIDHAVLPFATSCQILPAALDGDACLVGAAALIHQPDRYASARFHAS